MENNNSEKWQDHKDSLGAAISSLAYPFDTLQEKIDCVNEGLKNHKGSQKDKQKFYKDIFKKYFENKKTYNFYKLFVPEMKIL